MQTTLDWIEKNIGLAILLGPLLISVGIFAASLQLPRLLKGLAVLFFVGTGTVVLWQQCSQIWDFMQSNQEKPHSAMQTLTGQT